MIVDASSMVDALTARSQWPRMILKPASGRLHAPSVFPAEVTSALRRLLLSGQIREFVATSGRRRLESLPTQLHPFGPYAERIWELRDNLTVYDAWYVAIAERLRQPLVTADAGILTAPGLRCELIDARAASQSL